jgi:hypothetical protein
LLIKKKSVGNRIAKHVYNNTGTTHERSTYYILDAQGNQISTYDHEVVSETAQFNLKERNIFGSSRLGSKQDSLNVLTATLTQNYTQILGTKYYEFSNHLGNVLTVFSDVKIALDTNSNGIVDGFRVPIRNTADYSPFGVQLDGRKQQVNFYRRGFNGQEKVDEISGSGNHNTALFWEYDTRLGRRWNRDPKPNPSLSDYATFANNPIWFNDPLGDIFKIGTKDSKAKDDVKDLTKSKNQKYLKFQDDGEVKTDFSGLSQKKIDRILKKDEGLSLINSLSTAKDGEGKDLNFFYGTEGSTGIGLENPQMQGNVPDYYSNISTLDNKGGAGNDGGYDPRAFVLNASTQQYSSSSKYGLKPLDNYDGKVFIGRGTFKVFGVQQSPIRDVQGNITGYSSKEVLLTVPRSSILFHELRESLLRTAHGNCYDQAHDNAGGVGGVSKFYTEEKK